MKRSCLITLMTWVALGAAYYYYLHGRYEPPADWIAAIAGSFFSTLGIGALRNVRIHLRNRRLVAASARPQAIRGRRLAAFCGRISASGKPLEGPFSGKPAVVVDYEISDPTATSGSSGSSSNVLYSGFLMTPSIIRSSMGDIKLLGYPDMNGFEEEYYGYNEISQRADSFIASTTFEKMNRTSVMSNIQQLKEVFLDDDGTIEKNWRFEDEPAISDSDFKETIVPDGEEVCAIGIYHPERSGIISDFSGKGIMVELYKGSRQSVQRLIAQKMRGMLIAAFFFLIAVNGIIAFVLDRYSSAPSQISERTTRFIDALDKDDINAAARILPFQVDVNQANSAGETPLMRVKSAAAAKLLIDHGAILNLKDTNGRTALMRAVQADRKEVVETLIEAGADLNAKDKWDETALSLAKDSKRSELAELLLKAGAADEEISAATGTPLTASDAPVKIAIEYLQAMQRGDIKAMGRLYRDGAEDNFDDVDLKLWQDTRPKSPQLIEGYTNGSAATILLGGQSGSGTFNSIWLYQLEKKEDGSWRILKERWR
ncbi:MAG: ankyrin repeat domain-containing protein [Deltaproteobacteria bacterium]|nr:ankyrin repeat domain-containing protein [Deltaproteobacteria bacterium]